MSVLRMLLSSLSYKEVEKRKPLTEEEFYAVVKTMIKQHGESIESFKKGQRPDLAEKEEKELQILKEFVPAQMSERGAGRRSGRRRNGAGGEGPERHGEGDEIPHGKTCIPRGWEGAE